MDLGKYFVMAGTFIIITSLIFLIPDKKTKLQNKVNKFSWNKIGPWKKRRTLFQIFILGLITLHIAAVHFGGMVIPSICPRSSTDLATNAGLFGLSAVYWLTMYLLVFIWGRVVCSWFCVYSFVQERSNDVLRSFKMKVLNTVKNNIIIYLVTSVFWGSVIYNVTKLYLTKNGLEFNLSNGYKVADLWVFYGGMITLLPLTMFLTYFFGNRFFCKYVCPVGGLMSLYSRFSFLKIKIDHTRCKNCKRCSRDCQMGVPIDKHIKEKSPVIIDRNCIVCGDCIDSCKFSALKYGFLLIGKTKQPVKDDIRDEDTKKVA